MAVSDLHGVPTAVELVEAVREFLERDVMTSTDGRVQFHTRVAVKVLGMVERELNLGETQRAERAARMESLGVADEAELAAVIKRGDLDDRLREVVDAVRADVEARLAVANPTYGAPSVD